MLILVQFSRVIQSYIISLYPSDNWGQHLLLQSVWQCFILFGRSLCLLNFVFFLLCFIYFTTLIPHFYRLILSMILCPLKIYALVCAICFKLLNYFLHTLPQYFFKYSSVCAGLWLSARKAAMNKTNSLPSRKTYWYVTLWLFSNCLLYL